MSGDKNLKKADQLFGQIARQLEIVTKEQLESALETQRNATEHKPLGIILMESGHVKEGDFERILQAQKAMAAAIDTRAKAVREDSLFGKVAVRLGFCTQEQVAVSLQLQEQLPRDRFMRLGDIMIIKGYLKAEHVKKIVDMQQGLVLYCPKCDTQYNVVMFRPGASLQCYRCGSALRIPTRPFPLSAEGVPRQD